LTIFSSVLLYQAFKNEPGSKGAKPQGVSSKGYKGQEPACWDRLGVRNKSLKFLPINRLA
jgi:hypothetical protein